MLNIMYMLNIIIMLNYILYILHILYVYMLNKNNQSPIVYNFKLHVS